MPAEWIPPHTRPLPDAIFPRGAHSRPPTGPLFLRLRRRSLRLPPDKATGNMRTPPGGGGGGGGGGPFRFRMPSHRPTLFPPLPRPQNLSESPSPFPFTHLLQVLPAQALKPAHQAPPTKVQSPFSVFLYKNFPSNYLFYSLPPFCSPFFSTS